MHVMHTYHGKRWENDVLVDQNVHLVDQNDVLVDQSLVLVDQKPSGGAQSGDSSS